MQIKIYLQSGTKHYDVEPTIQIKNLKEQICRTEGRRQSAIHPILQSYFSIFFCDEKASHLMLRI